MPLNTGKSGPLAANLRLSKENKIGLHDGQCIIALPQRGNVGEDATSTEASWTLNLPDGIDFDGQHFKVLSAGANSGSSVEAAAEARWLEPSLLSVKISVQGNVSAPCARCLRETELAISDDLMYLYILRGHDEQSKSGSGSENDPDDLGDEFMPVEIDYFGRTLDVTPQVLESLLLLLPSKVLCREDCAGLCPNCGADLNDGPCGCKIDNGDPRLEALRNFTLSES